jgi:hypothetical protein
MVRVSRIFAFMVLAIGGIQTALANWNGTAWGMTPTEVGRITGAKAKKIKTSIKDRDSIGKLGNRGVYEAEGIRYTARYYYDDRGLKGIQLENAKLKCSDILASLTRQYGPHMKHSDRMILHLFIWHDLSGQNRIRLVVSGTGKDCWTHIERLSDFEVMDKQNTN